MEFSKKDAKMTQGFAVLCMLVLHLFCRTGADVLGTPLLWLNGETPFVYWLGFFAEICVPLYSFCAGYARMHLWEKGKTGMRSNAKRIGRLMVNYWIIVFFFSAVCMLLGIEDMPGSGTNFLKSLVLLHSYNGAWWYLNTYILCLLIPDRLILYPVKRLNVHTGIVCCLAVQVCTYLAERFGFLSVGNCSGASGFVVKETVNLLQVLPHFWIGALLCKGRVLTHARAFWQKKGCNAGLLVWALGLFVCTNLIHKAVLTGIVAIAAFLLFNLWEKGNAAERVLTFLGDHSTNIWLTHMFFYAYVFKGLVEKAKYPIPMLLFMLALCIVVSYVIKGIQRILYRCIHSLSAG